mmetsp:Transcript_22566/g.61054  ORF Transcript_22566/g.61054 Transcript_22566/m.61054 type:complete len:314 (-) Transcript_22566:13-954(-)
MASAPFRILSLVLASGHGRLGGIAACTLPVPQRGDIHARRLRDREALPEALECLQGVEHVQVATSLGTLPAVACLGDAGAEHADLRRQGQLVGIFCDGGQVAHGEVSHTHLAHVDGLCPCLVLGTQRRRKARHVEDIDAVQWGQVALHERGGTREEGVARAGLVLEFGHEELRHAKVHVDEEPSVLGEDRPLHVQDAATLGGADDGCLVLLAHLAPPGHAGVGNHVVGRAHAQHLLNGAVHARWHHGALHAVERAWVAKVLGESSKLGLGAGVDNDISTRLEHATCEGATDGPNATDDERRLALEIHTETSGG